jgi:hypothetical protein
MGHFLVTVWGIPECPQTGSVSPAPHGAFVTEQLNLRGDIFMKRLITALAGGATIATLAFASASALTVDGGVIQSGQDGVTCDTDGVKANWGLETDDNSVRSVRITGIDPACVGADMFVMVNGAKIGQKTIAGVQESFPMTSRTPESIQDVRVTIEG